MKYTHYVPLLSGFGDIDFLFPCKLSVFSGLDSVVVFLCVLNEKFMVFPACISYPVQIFGYKFFFSCVPCLHYLNIFFFVLTLCVLEYLILK